MHTCTYLCTHPCTKTQCADRYNITLTCTNAGSLTDLHLQRQTLYIRTNAKQCNDTRFLKQTNPHWSLPLIASHQVPNLLLSPFSWPFSVHLGKNYNFFIYLDEDPFKTLTIQPCPLCTSLSKLLQQKLHLPFLLCILQCTNSNNIHTLQEQVHNPKPVAEITVAVVCFLAALGPVHFQETQSAIRTKHKPCHSTNSITAQTVPVQHHLSWALTCCCCLCTWGDICSSTYNHHNKIHAKITTQTWLNTTQTKAGKVWENLSA